MLTLSRPINILLLISQSAAGPGKKKTALLVNGYYCSCTYILYFEAVE